MRSRVVTSVLAGIAVVTALAACAGRADPGGAGGVGAGSAPAVSGAPIATAEASSAPTIAGDYDLCETFLPAGVAATLQKLDAPMMGDELEQIVLRDEPGAADFGGITLARFVHRGGIICSWGAATEGGLTLTIAYGPIASGEVPIEQAALIAAGSARISPNRFSDENLGLGEYVFGDGYWLYVASESSETDLFGGSTDAFADAVIANLPAF